MLLNLIRRNNFPLPTFIIDKINHKRRLHRNPMICTEINNLKVQIRRDIIKRKKVLILVIFLLIHFNIVSPLYDRYLIKFDELRVQKMQDSCLRFSYGIRNIEILLVRRTSLEKLVLSQRDMNIPKHNTTLLKRRFMYQPDS